MGSEHARNPGLAKRCLVRLYVAGNAPNSRMARENLERIRGRFPRLDFAIEVIDVNSHADEALEQGVFITPALQVIEPEPGGMVYGNLSDLDSLDHLFAPDAWSGGSR
jgi:circadian clock protein KaiB